MNPSRFHALGFTLAIIFSLATTQQSFALDRDSMENALAQITVYDGNKPVSRATGFVWQKPEWVVTSLHVMRKGANFKYTVKSPKHDGTWFAEPVASLEKHDLVMLEIKPKDGKSLPAWKPYKSTGKVPGFAEDVFAIGYYSDTPDPRIIELSVESSLPLERKIPKEHSKAIKAGKIPDVREPVIHFMGTSLLPGYSGSPLFDKQGNLVGIGNGGLEKGAVDISWGIHATHLSALTNAFGSALPASLGSANQQLYSAEISSEVEIAPIKVGPFEFLYTKTRSFADLRQTVDNPADFEYQLSWTENLDVSQLEFDIYQDINRGVVIAVPKGSDLVVDGDVLRADFNDYSIYYRVDTYADDRLVHLLAEDDVHASLVDLYQQGDSELVYDPDSSSCDRSLEGGVVATVMFEDNSNDGFLFNKSAIRGDVYMASSVSLWASEEEQQTLESDMCMVDSYSCSGDGPCSTLCHWMHAFAAVYMTSFSNFQAAGQGCLREDQPLMMAALNPDITTYQLNGWDGFSDVAQDLEFEGIYVSDLEVIASEQEWLVGGVHQDLPVQTYWRYGYTYEEFDSEIQSLAELGYQLKDLEISWDGDWKYAGVFQADSNATWFKTYESSDELTADYEAMVNDGWAMIDIEVPWFQDVYYYGVVYQQNVNETYYQFAQGVEQFHADIDDLASQGWHLSEMETFWVNGEQWLVGIYSDQVTPATLWYDEWSNFEQQIASFQDQGLYIDDLEIVPYNDGAGTKWAYGVFH